jgi:hypothetical protein
MPGWPKQRLGAKVWHVCPKVKSQVREIAASGAKANQAVALARIEAVRWAVESALSGDVSLRNAAEVLNMRGIACPGGGRWHAAAEAARRLGLHASFGWSPSVGVFKFPCRISR